MNARIAKVVFGAYDTKAGAMGSMTDITQLPVNHKPEIVSGVLQEECSALLREFFRAKRERGARWNK